MPWDTWVFTAFLGLSIAAGAGMVLYGWRHRKDRMPQVPPLPKDDDWD